MSPHNNQSNEEHLLYDMDKIESEKSYSLGDNTGKHLKDSDTTGRALDDSSLVSSEFSEEEQTM